MTNSPDFLLTEEEHSVLCGALLTDAHLQKRGKSYRMRICHKKEHKSLVDFQYKKLQRLCETTQPPKETLKNWEFTLSSGFYLKAYHDLFYQKVDGSQKYVKVITPELLEFLPKTPEFLAVAWCCDGHARNDCYSGRFVLHSFTKEELELFVAWLEEHFGIKSKVQPHNTKKGNYFQVIFSAKSESFPRFASTIEPVVKQIPDLVYKLNEVRKAKARSTSND